MTAARQLAAILAPVVGASRLMGEDEAGTAKIVRERREVAPPIVRSFGGRLVHTIDDAAPSFRLAAQSGNDNSVWNWRIVSVEDGMVKPVIFTVSATWDAEACAWSGHCDDIPAAAEASTSISCWRRCRRWPSTWRPRITRRRA